MTAARLEERARTVSNRQILLIAVAFGVIRIFFTGYRLGVSDQVSQLPFILRLLDPTFLQNDWYVNDGVAFGPRFYYSHFIAFLARAFPLEIVFVVLTFMTNTATAAVTMMFTRAVFGGSVLTALLATALVMTVEPFNLSTGNWLVKYYLTPSFLARPIAFAALWMGVQRRPLACSGLACAAAIIHPTLGLETGAIALVAAGVGCLSQSGHQYELRALLKSRTLIGALILAGFVFVFWIVPQSGAKLDDEQFIKILIFRAEGSLIASRFSLVGYLHAAIFLLGFAVAWTFCWRRSAISRSTALALLAVVVSVLVFCAVGYFLVEVVPTRAGVTLWPFRMLFVVQWIGLIVLSGATVRWIVETERKLSWLAYGAPALCAAVFLYLIADVEPVPLALAVPVVAFGAMRTAWHTLKIVSRNMAAPDNVFPPSARSSTDGFHVVPRAAVPLGAAVPTGEWRALPRGGRA